MASIEYVLSVRYENGRPIFIEGYPSNPGEELLTDDGKDERADSIDALARDEGNDVLTLTAPLAKRLQVSRGTVSSREELLSALGLERTGQLVPGRSERIMKDWSDGLESAKVQIKAIQGELQDLRVDQPGGFDQRTKFRGIQRRKYEDLRALLIKWGEGLDPYWMNRNGIPLAGADPDISYYNTVIEKNKIDQLKDRK